MNSRYRSVWDALQETPEQAENMTLRSSVMMALKKHLIQTKIRRADPAKLFGGT